MTSALSAQNIQQLKNRRDGLSWNWDLSLGYSRQPRSRVEDRQKRLNLRKHIQWFLDRRTIREEMQYGSRYLSRRAKETSGNETSGQTKNAPGFLLEELGDIPKTGKPNLEPRYRQQLEKVGMYFNWSLGSSSRLGAKWSLHKSR